MNMMDKHALDKIQEVRAQRDEQIVINSILTAEIEEKDERIKVLEGQLARLIQDRQYEVAV